MFWRKLRGRIDPAAAVLLEVTSGDLIDGRNAFVTNSVLVENKRRKCLKRQLYPALLGIRSRNKMRVARSLSSGLASRYFVDLLVSRLNLNAQLSNSFFERFLFDLYFI